MLPPEARVWRRTNIPPHSRRGKTFANAVGRIGGASALFSVGCSPETIKAMGRWWSGAYLLYIRSMQGNARSLMVAACSHKGEYLPDTPDDDDPEDNL